MAKKTVSLMGAAAILLVTGACSSGGDNKAASSADLSKMTSQPVELGVYIHTGGYPMTKFMEFYGNAVQKKYPNFSFKLYTPGTGTSLPELMAQGANIDLIQSHRANTFELMYDLKLLTDISDLIKKYGYDVNKIEPVVLDEMRQLGNGKILGLPYESRATGLFYNKQLFDKFGVSYPKNNMTWDETAEMAKKLSRIDAGVNYEGILTYPRHVFLMNQLAQGYMNPTTNKATLSTDNWKKIFETLQQLHQIPNNPYVVPGKVSNTFWVDGRSAMYAAMFVPDATYIMDAKFDWDVVSLPELKDRKGVSSGLLNYYWTMTSISKNRDQAFLAEAFWASEEYQKAQARKGYIPSLKGSSYNDVLGKDIPAYASRSLKSLKTNPAGSYVVNQYQGIADKQLDSAFDAIFANNKDINTVLREAEETANKQIQDAIAKAAK